MKYSGVKPVRKLFVNSFLSVRNTADSSRIGNPSQIVSCRYKYSDFKSDKKLFKNSFLSVRNTAVPSRIGNSFLTAS
jgi:hypothetical protein